MEHFLDGNGDGRMIWIGIHDVGHHVPPTLRYLVDAIRGVLRATGSIGNLLIAIQDVGILIPIDAVVAHTGILDLFRQLGPEGSMALLVLFLTAWLEEHLKGKSFHFEVFVFGGYEVVLCSELTTDKLHN